ncbi:EscU/YscU/HrcU family type III secretion system export apparatus switch protein [Marinicrinis sediminis]|uniref:EscU/YscU/HrcU family type III secretion system export apparatus switch protein n=1 Tax=Marinicrinis sediminis TaxID=1652465 RepID=A0ABW5R591_9BACL
MNEKQRPQGKSVKKAAALQYHPSKHEAPVLVAKGAGLTADHIVKLASEHGIPVQEDASLVEILSQLDLDQQIPPELYQLVAEILSFIYQTDQQMNRTQETSWRPDNDHPTF